MRVYDITQPLFECEVYPGDAAPSYRRVKSVAVHGYCLTEIAMCVHNGTHIDAPAHFIEGGAGVGRLPLDAFFGKCRVKPWDGEIPQGCERLLIRGCYELTAADAALIAKSGVRLVGVEGQSVGKADAPAEVHRILLSAGVIPLEGIVLRDVPDGEYALSAFPLNLGGECDGSPVRAALIELGGCGKRRPL
jgi:arylformamidase